MFFGVSKLYYSSASKIEYVSDGSEMIFLDANGKPWKRGKSISWHQQRIFKGCSSEAEGVKPENIPFGNGMTKY